MPADSAEGTHSGGYELAALPVVQASATSPRCDTPIIEGTMRGTGQANFAEAQEVPVNADQESATKPKESDLNLLEAGSLNKDSAADLHAEDLPEEPLENQLQVGSSEEPREDDQCAINA